MTATAEPPAPEAGAPGQAPLSPAEGVELLGPVHGCGYRDGACLVRRGDGQMVQLGPLMYGLLECVDGERDTRGLAEALSEQLGRPVDEKPVARLAQKLADQGLLAGSEGNAPPRRNPLLALRWKILVTNPKLTQRLTAPFAFLFRPWLMWPILAAFVAVFWFVLIHKGVAAATAQAFHSPGLLLLVFALAVISAGLHELGHAAACRYGGATPGGMGMGLYLVWPAFYTDVTDTYRLPRRSRLRVDLAGLYFNAAVAVVTMAVWLVIHADALLLLVALQVLQMIKQLSPVIRADGYHILADATGVPDLYSHMGPTLRRLLPGRGREPSALTGRARALVTIWVLIVVPVLLSLMLGAIVLLPRIITSAWESGRHIVLAVPNQASHGQIIDLLASVVRLLALCLPVAGSALVTQKIVRTTVGRARSWSQGSAPRTSLAVVAGAAVVAAMAWAWWPSGQYQPVRASQNGTLGGLVKLVSAPGAIARPIQAVAPGQRAQLTPGTHLALSMIPVGGATRSRPALFFIAGSQGKPPVAIVSPTSPTPPAHVGGPGSPGTPSPTTAAGAGTSTAASGTSTAASGTGTAASASSRAASGGASTRSGSGASTTAGGGPDAGGSSSATGPTAANAFPFRLPALRPGDNRAVAVGTRKGGTTYDVAYSLVTVRNGAPVTEKNSAYALAKCNACTTVAVSFQIVLVVGQSNIIAPINEAEALNQDCPACTTTAIADQIVVTLKSQPPRVLVAELDADLRRLNALSALGASGSPAVIAADVAAVQQQVDTQLNASGLLTKPIATSSGTTSSQSSTTAAASQTATSTSQQSTTGTSPQPSSATTSSTATSPASASPPAASSSSTTTTTTAPAGSSSTATTAGGGSG